MRFDARLVVRTKSGVRDPQADAIGGVLSHVGAGAITVARSGKMLDLSVEAPNKGAATAAIEEACRAVLVNPALEEYAIEFLGAP